SCGSDPIRLCAEAVHYSERSTLLQPGEDGTVPALPRQVDLAESGLAQPVQLLLDGPKPAARALFPDLALDGGAGTALRGPLLPCQQPVRLRDSSRGRPHGGGVEKRSARGQRQVDAAEDPFLLFRGGPDEARRADGEIEAGPERGRPEILRHEGNPLPEE